MKGYLSTAYAGSLSEWGRPVHLPRSGGWVLERNIPGSELADARAVYPLLCCNDWRALKQDLDELGRRWVSLVAVCDPLGDCSRAELSGIFRDKLLDFKVHYLVDLRDDPADFASSSHKRRWRKAARQLTVDEVAYTGQVLDDWERLYSNLARRHRIRGLRRFSRKSFARQLQVPGMSIWRASLEGETVGMTLWYVDRNHGYYHLGASSDSGYILGASHALFGAALEAFRHRGIRLLDLGGGHGLSRQPKDGLVRFKRGWSNKCKTALLGGCIFNQEAYEKLAAAAGREIPDYFPAYRGAPAPTTTITDTTVHEPTV